MHRRVGGFIPGGGERPQGERLLADDVTHTGRFKTGPEWEDFICLTAGGAIDRLASGTARPKRNEKRRIVIHQLMVD